MQRSSGGTVFDPVQPARQGDREMVLGPFMLALIGCCLFGLCGLCFVFGYAVGHRNAEASTAISVPPPALAALAQSGNAQSKPSAGQSGAQLQAASPEATDTGAVEPTTGEPIATAAGAATQPSGDSADPAVRAVLTTQPGNAQSPAGGTVHPALGASAAAGIMVQIAAVAHPEDADVLVGALRKRAYAVTARRDPTDGLLHVQIGPFANRSDAYAMRQKLLNDGYNAIVQP